MNNKFKKIFCIVLAGICVVAAGVIYAFSFQKQNTVIEGSETEPYTDTKSQSKDISLEDETVCVYACGCVNNPGVVSLKAGSRIFEVVKACGGLTENADANRINQAETVIDGQQIYFPEIGENVSGYSEAADKDNGLVNINTANADELMTLPGIGQTRADAIVAYRESSGGFGTIEDIMMVTGIKESSFNKIKDYICV